MADKSCDWSPVTTDEWGETLAGWPWSGPKISADGDRVWNKQGVCPRCGHTITAEFGTYPILGINPIDHKKVPPLLSIYVTAICNCGFPHKGQPADNPNDRGCGSRMDILVPKEARGEMGE